MLLVVTMPTCTAARTTHPRCGGRPHPRHCVGPATTTTVPVCRVMVVAMPVTGGAGAGLPAGVQCGGVSTRVRPVNVSGTALRVWVPGRRPRALPLQLRALQPQPVHAAVHGVCVCVCVYVCVCGWVS